MAGGKAEAKQRQRRNRAQPPEKLVSEQLNRYGHHDSFARRFVRAS
jgi:hypothetical protein